MPHKLGSDQGTRMRPTSPSVSLPLPIALGSRPTNPVSTVDAMPLRVLLGKSVTRIERDPKPTAPVASSISWDKVERRREVCRPHPIMLSRDDPSHASGPHSFRFQRRFGHNYFPPYEYQQEFSVDSQTSFNFNVTDRGSTTRTSPRI